MRGSNRYFGSIELASAGDGLVVVNRLGLERYLLGLNEVPRDWPVEALQAQAVAARTYALWTLAQPAGGAAATYGFDICASTLCQVFSGADVVLAPDGHRWETAVEDTKGMAVLYRGEPILARYHSTAGGRTLSNSQAFPEEERDFPYLQPVDSRTDEHSPLYRWRTELRRRHLRAMLARRGWDNGRLLSARTVPSDQGLHYPDVVLRGSRGTWRLTAQQLRELVRDLAPEMFPNRYPAPALTSSGRLPETMPSNRITITTRGSLVLVTGRGWGHGVGMSQWGAYGLARDGASYEEILGHYYSGAIVGSVEDPGTIDVGVDWGRPSVAISGDFSVVDGNGRTVVKRALGTWRFKWSPTGAVAIEAPRGFGLPLEIGIVKAPTAVDVGEPVYITVALSRPARVRTLTGAGTSDASETLIRDAGARRIPWLAPVEPGSYEVRVRASGGGSVRTSEPVTVQVVAADTVGEGDEGAGAAPGEAPYLPLASAVGLTALALVIGFTVVLLSRMRR